MHAEIATLEAAGWYQEHYRLHSKRFFSWNDGVWSGKWQLVRDRCALCNSVDQAIQVNDVSLCLPCLSEYPNVPWHPTGSVRPSIPALLRQISTRLQLSEGY